MNYRSHRKSLVLFPSVLLIVLLGFLLTSCSSKNSSATQTSVASATNGHHEVLIKNFAFNPSKIVASPGEVIIVHNEDPVVHTLTSTTNQFNTGDINPGSTKTFKAPIKPGSYPFYCIIHPFMTGVLIVK